MSLTVRFKFYEILSRQAKKSNFLFSVNGVLYKAPCLADRSGSQPDMIRSDGISPPYLAENAVATFGEHLVRDPFPEFFSVFNR